MSNPFEFKNLQKNGSSIFIKLLLALFAGVSSFQLLPPPDTSAAGEQLRQAVALMQKKQYEAAIPKITDALDVFDRAGARPGWIEVCKKLDRCYYELGRPDEGIAFFEKALQKTDLPDGAYANLFLLLADNFFLKNDYLLATETYEKGLEYAENEHASELLLGYYGSLGWLYWNAGNHAKALEFQKKSLELATREQDTDNIPIILSYIGDTYRSMNDTLAFVYFRRSLALKPDNMQARIQFSKTFQQFGMPDSALAVLDAALPLLRGDTDKADAYYQFSRLMLDSKDMPRAVSYVGKALKHGLAGYGEKNSEYARIMTLAGKVYLAGGYTDQALHWFDQTLFQQSRQRPEHLEMNDLPPGSYWILGSLEGKGKAFFQKYQNTKNTRNLYSALDAFELGLGYGEKMRLSHSHESSKLELYEYIQPIVEGCVKTALELAKTSGDSAFTEKAYLFTERAKAPVMAEALYDAEIKHVAGVPDSVLTYEKALQEAVVKLETAVYDQPENDTLRQTLFDTRFALARLKDEIKSRFPRYFELKYAFSKQTDLQQIRQFLDDDALLVQYLMGDSTLYCFAVSRQHIRAYTLPLRDTLDAMLARFRKTVADWNYVKYSTAQAEQDFLTTAPMLYQLLLARPLAEEKARKLIIVPDGYLGLIPFEALLTTVYSGSWKNEDVPYLIRDYPISYAWSAGSLKKSQPAPDTLQYDFVGIGTTYEVSGLIDTIRGGLGALPNAVKEVEAIGRLLPGKIWLDAEATKENFLASAPDCSILHITTHGVLDERNPMHSCLMFNKSQGDNRLFASELYNIRLQARMAVLSACNTGQGMVQNGEGMMSLARAFAFAGCPTQVGGLWSINDLSTSRLMKSFYQSLIAGKPVDEAMQAAKLEYLKSTTSEFTKPIYWASFVVIGNTGALPEYLLRSGCIPIWVWGSAAAGLLIFVLYFFRRRLASLLRNKPV